MASGRVNALLIATRGGHVVYERFYDPLSESEKAEVRGACDQVAGPRSGGGGVAAAEDEESVGRYRNGRLVMIPSGDLLFFALGTGEYNELALSELLRLVIAAYKDIFKAPALSDALLFQHYATTVLVLDEVCKAGLIELTDSASIVRAMALRLPFEGSAAPSSGSSESKGKTLKKMFTKSAVSS